ncbi:MAG: bifunctional UDP-N-acetylglucosamine diphosphorylase/glucosamine-1-phosphate N-acetyltransferase GlmU, partial [Planctomycetota bacterium]
TCGDMPFISSATYRRVWAEAEEGGADAVILTGILSCGGSFGRILRSSSGEIVGIREARDASEGELAIREVNGGVYCFRISLLIQALGALRPDNAQGELYLTDTISYLVGAGCRVVGVEVGNVYELFGINTPEQLRVAERILAESSPSQRNFLALQALGR